MRIFGAETPIEACAHQPGFRLRRLAPLALALAAGVAHAQFRASIQGTVTDPTGAVIPGAKVSLRDTGTGRTLTATSNASGVYNFEALPPDHFTLTASAGGFKQKVIEDLTITPEQANSVNLQLDLGESSTTVTVSGNTVPALDTETANLQGTVTSNEIQHLPSAGRDVFQLAQLAPGVFGEAEQNGSGGTHTLPGSQGPGQSSASTGIFGTENGPQVLSSGGQYETNSISIDGISTTSAVWGGTTVITPNEDSVENIKISSNAYDAENGRFSGTQMQVTSKSGTNTIHGSFFFRANRPGLNAYQRYNGPGSLVPGSAVSRGLQKDTGRFNQFGGSIGGPIWKNHVFAFFAYETIRNNSTATANGWYETPAFEKLTGAPISSKYLTFAGQAPSNPTLINETCKTAGLVENVNCVTIPGQGLNIGSPLTTGPGTQDPNWTSATSPGVGGGLSNVADIAHYQTASPSLSTQAQYNGRIDADVTGKDHLAFAIYWVPSSSQYYNGPARAYNLWNHSVTNDAFSVIWNHTFSSTFLNEARANAAGWRYNELTTNPQAPFGLPVDNINQIGSVSLSNFGGQNPSDYNQWTYTYKDVATKVAGNHTIKFGGEVTRLYYLQSAVGSARPTYSFFNMWDFLNDAPEAEQGTFDRFTGIPTSNRFDMRENLWGFFAQDGWKIRPNMTINAGLRYSYYGALYAKQNNLPNLRFGTGSSLFTGMYIQRGGNAWDPQKGNFGPQIGLNWSPERFHNRVVFRGGYGLNFNQEEIAISSNVTNNPNDSVSASYSSPNPSAIDPNIVYAIPGSPSTFNGYPANPHTVTTYNTANLPTNSILSLNAIPPSLRTAYTHHYSLDTEVDLGHQFVATVGYQGSSARHLITNSNLYIWGEGQGYPFNPQINFINYFGDYSGSNYNALLLTLNHTMAHHFTANMNFTYAKSMDDGSGPYERDPYPYNDRFAYGRSDFNFGKALKLFGVWQPVFFHGAHGWMEKVVGGWSLSGIYNFRTGFPWTPQVNGSSAYYPSSGYGTFRPASYNGRASRNYANDEFKPGPDGYNGNFAGGGLAYFTAPVVTPTSFPVPGIARNSFDGPRYMDLDGTLTKSFGLPNTRVLGENANIEIRADSFNLLNLTNLDIGSISNTITASDFGVIHSALGSRTINLQARFSF